MKNRVWIVGFDPIEGRAGVGGWNWYYSMEEALVAMLAGSRESNGTHFYWVRPFDSAFDTSRVADITEQIQKRIITLGPDGDWQ